MAASHVWGIDIGQCGFKALRGRLADDGQSVVAESYDYIEYPQILSQPDANPDELIREALKTFLSRNSLRGDKVAISLSGQTGLARFIKLPPVDSKQLPNLVGFEAKQQIPFALEDVVWDYERISAEPGTGGGGDDDDDDLPMETEVGLFAIKRDQVLRSIRQLVDAEVELDIIQLSPIAIYNAIGYDQLESDSEAADINSTKWIAVLSMGTDTSDLVLTNGKRIWQRSVPIGGNHFTKQLTTDLKLTFAKAEQVKKNAREAKDAKQIFQAMRSVFNDLVTEVQRSIGYFGSLERDAEIQGLVAIGNAVKLPGLPQYLEKNLGMPVTKLEEFARLAGPGVTDDNQFQENLLAFPVCYGLVLQGLGKGALSTNLVPREIIRARMIRQKKPWAAAIAASLLLACAFNFFFKFKTWDEVNLERTVNNSSWEDADRKLDLVKNTYNSLKSDDAAKVETLSRLEGLGEATVGSDDGRKLWLELLKTITDVLPIDTENPDSTKSPLQHPMEKRPEIYIDAIESQYFPELSEWNTAAVQEKYQLFMTERREDEQQRRQAEAAAVVAEPGEDAEPIEEQPVEEEAEALTIEGGGWVIEIQGHHFQRDGKMSDARYVRKTLLEQLADGMVELPIDAAGTMMEFHVKELGILSPIMFDQKRDLSVKIPNTEYEPPVQEANSTDRGGGFGSGSSQPAEPEAADPDNPKSFTPPRGRFVFKVQFAWKQIPLKVRLKERQRKLDRESAEEGGI